MNKGVVHQSLDPDEISMDNCNSVILWKQLAKEIKNIKPDVENFSEQIFPVSEMKSNIQFVLDACSYKNLVLTDEAVIMISKVVEIHALDLAAKSKIKAKATCRNVLEVKPVRLLL